MEMMPSVYGVAVGMTSNTSGSEGNKWVPPRVFGSNAVGDIEQQWAGKARRRD